MRRPKHRIPAQPPEVPAGMMLPDCGMHRKRRPRQAPAYQGQEEGGHELDLSRASHEVVPTPSRSSFVRVAVILSHAVKRSNPNTAAAPLRVYPNSPSHVVTARVVTAGYCHPRWEMRNTLIGKRWAISKRSQGLGYVRG